MWCATESLRRGDSVRRARHGRPAVVVVQEGHVAVLEKLGRYSSELGPRTPARLRRARRVHKVILTGPRPLVGTVDCSTSDSVPVTAEFELEARILAEPGRMPSRRINLEQRQDQSGGSAADPWLCLVAGRGGEGRLRVSRLGAGGPQRRQNSPSPAVGQHDPGAISSTWKRRIARRFPFR